MEVSGGACPDNCFDSSAGQAVVSQGGPGSDWMVAITQCIKVLLPSELLHMSLFLTNHIGTK